jgi:hypothetical protein
VGSFDGSSNEAGVDEAAVCTSWVSLGGAVTVDVSDTSFDDVSYDAFVCAASFMTAVACFTVVRFTFCFCKKCKNSDGKMATVFMYVRYLKLQITASFTYFMLYHQYAGMNIIFPGTSSTSSVLIFA